MPRYTFYGRRPGCRDLDEDRGLGLGLLVLTAIEARSKAEAVRKFYLRASADDKRRWEQAGCQVV